ncbi:MAG: type II secretion system protein GspK [Opitutaceae bacterium]|nr:type II secretion system protein GspK [Opitutaceae bacterium]
MPPPPATPSLTAALLPRGRLRRGFNSGGSVILLVLVMLFFASLALSRFIEKAGVELLAEVRAADQNRLRADAYSALEVTLAVLAEFMEVDGGLYAPAQGWDQPLDYAGYTPRHGVTVAIAYEDESGRISLPRLNQTTMQVMLESFGVPQRDAERITDALMAWMRPNYVAASFDTDPHVYESADPAYQPPQRSLRSFHELAAIAVARDYFYDQDGEPTGLWRTFADNVSLYDFAGANLNAARPATMAIAGFDSSQAGLINSYLTGQQGPRAPGVPPYFRSLNEALGLLGPSAPGSSLDVQIRALRINITVQEGAASFRVSAVVAPPGGATAVGPVPPPSAPPPASSPVPAAASPANAVSEPSAPIKLNYPFKILEIQEDADRPLSLPTESPAL